MRMGATRSCKKNRNHKYSPLQITRVQALDDDHEWSFREHLLCDRGCLHRSQLFFSKREHRQHVSSNSKKNVVQPISWCHDIHVVSFF